MDINILGYKFYLKKIDIKFVRVINLKMDRLAQLTKIQTEARELFKKKNTDYGDAFATYGPVGVLVRMGDKITRMQNITNNGINLVETEKLRDTLIDLHNYAAMAVLLIDEKEPTN